MTEVVQDEALAQTDETPNDLGSAPETNGTADTAEQPEEHKVPKGVQKRIDRLTREKYRLQGELDAIRRHQVQPQQQTQTQAADEAPKPEQYSTYEDFLEAKAEWKAERKVAQMLAERDASSRRSSEQAEQAELQRAWEKRMESALEAYDDYEDVALNPDVPVTQTMAQAIQLAEKGADVLYYLGKHPEEAGRIAKLDKTSQAIAIGRLEATISRPAAKKATDAPEPIKPVGARAAPTRDPEKMSTTEWMAWRNEQINSKRKR